MNNRFLGEQDLIHHPIERAETIPSRCYTDPMALQLESEHIFRSTWQCVGHVSRLATPGDYITATVADNPVIVVRGKDNVLRGFFNVCRHRGGPLAVDDGHCTMLQCRYHGWTYQLDGSLRGVPQFDRVELFDRKDFGLVPVQLAVWEGLVFVRLRDGVPALPELVDGIMERMQRGVTDPAGLRIATKRFSRRVTYEIRCNWKVYVDNYLEGYHLPHVHPELNTLLDYRKYVTETGVFHSLQYSPFAAQENLYSSPDGEAFYFFLWPNFMLNILPGRLQTNRVLPFSHNRTQVIFDYYYDDVTSEQAVRMIEEDIAFSDRVQREDIDICEHVQRGLESMAYDRGRFSVQCEQGVYHFQSLLRKAYATALR